MVLIEKGVGSEIVKAMMEIIGDDTTLLSNLLKSIKLAGEVGVPTEAIKTTGLFFIIGALPILLPFFVGQAWDSDPWIPAMAAFSLAILTISGAGFFVAVLSAKKILVKIAHSIPSSWGHALLRTWLVLQPGSFSELRLLIDSLLPAGLSLVRNSKTLGKSGKQG